MVSSHPQTYPYTSAPYHHRCYNMYLGCAEHINGNAIYRLGDKVWLDFLARAERAQDMHWGYDAFIMNYLKQVYPLSPSPHIALADSESTITTGGELSLLPKMGTEF